MSSGQTITMQGKVEDLLLDHLSSLWPEDVAHHARNWLTKNLRKGVISEATFSLKGHGEEGRFMIDDLNGKIDGEKAEITYLEGLPPAQNVNASATFDRKGFDIKILSGELKKIKVQEGHVFIRDLDTDDESLSLEAKATGPLPDILDVIDHKPLEYASYAGIDPQKVKGEGKITLHVDLPFIADLAFKDVKMAAKGDFKKVALERKITKGINAQLTQGNFSLELTQDQMMVQGKGILNQLPSVLTYEHFFNKASPRELQIKVETTPSFEDFKRFGFDYQEYGNGLTKTSLTYTLEKNKKGYLSVDMDLTSSTLSVPPLEWGKKPGERGQVSFVLLFEEGNLSKMQDLKALFPPYSLQGDVLFDPQKKWKIIHLSNFKGPHSQAEVTFQNSSPNHYEISCKGQSVDLENFLKYLDKEGTEKDHTPTNVKLSADVKQLRFGEGKVFENVKASARLFLHGSDKIWQEVHLRARAGKGTAYRGDMAHVSGGILFDIKPGPHHTQILEVRANDAGKFLKNLSIYDEIRGGYLTIKAQREGQGPYKGVFKIKQFNANEIPLLARFAALLSPMGVVNLFSEKQTLSMDRFECNFEFSDDFISVKNGIGKSISLGFTTEGKLDRKKRLFSLNGNIIPARFLNSVLSNIPLIGPLINGGDGEGLFGIAYTVKESFDNPEVSLNPLSALAPGFFRKLFQSLGADEE